MLSRKWHRFCPGLNVLTFFFLDYVLYIYIYWQQGVTPTTEKFSFDRTSTDTHAPATLSTEMVKIMEILRYH